MGTFKMDMLKLYNALKFSKEAQETVEETPATINNAVSLTQYVKVDLGDFVGVSTEMKKEIDFIATITEIIGEIIADGVTNEEELLEVLNTQGVEVFTGILSSLIKSGYLDSEQLNSVILPNMVRNGNLSIENLGKVISSMYDSGTMKNEDIGIILFELKRTNMMYVVDSNGFEDYAKQLNDLYGYDFDYVTLDPDLNERTSVGEYNEGNIAFRIRSNYTFNLDDLNTILKPMYDSGKLDASDLAIITAFSVITGCCKVKNQFLTPSSATLCSEKKLLSAVRVTEGHRPLKITSVSLNSLSMLKRSPLKPMSNIQFLTPKYLL